MTMLLFPGRHHLLTNFQRDYLVRATSSDLASLRDVEGQPLELKDRIDTIIWAMTSANHSNTRRNPLPAHRREVAIEEFADALDATSYVYLVDDIGGTDCFAQYVLKKIEVDSGGRFCLTPENTVVGCATPEVIAMYERLGFRILPFELADRATRTFCAETPWQLLMALVRAGEEGRDWRQDEWFLGKVAIASRRLYVKYYFGDLVIDLHRQALLTDDGDLTATRDYNTYVRSFDSGAKRKYDLVKDLVLPGRIVDVGCCTGSLIRELTLDDRFRESDFFGIEVARPLYAECLHRKEQGAFANDHVFFYQKDFAAGPMFAPNSVNTFLTFALTHEIESYAGRAALTRFLSLLHKQLTLGGRWINVDVIGPDHPDQQVYLKLNQTDGRSDDYFRDFPAGERDKLKAHLDGLSTHARFLRFARDFRRDEGYSLRYATETVAGEQYVVLRLQDACEFLSKKDYTDNWQSEMHETFCFWNFSQWQQAVIEAGFRLLPGSRAYVNPWIVENRYRGKAEIFCRNSAGDLAPMDYPVTNMVLSAEKAM